MSAADSEDLTRSADRILRCAAGVLAVIELLDLAWFMSDAREGGWGVPLTVLAVVGVIGGVLCLTRAPLWAVGVGCLALVVAPSVLYPISLGTLAVGVAAIFVDVRRRRAARAASPDAATD